MSVYILILTFFVVLNVIASVHTLVFERTFALLEMLLELIHATNNRTSCHSQFACAQR